MNYDFLKSDVYLKCISQDLLEALIKLDTLPRDSIGYLEAKKKIEESICKVEQVAYYAQLGIIVGATQEQVSKQEMKQHLENVVTDLFLKNIILEEVFLNYLNILNNE